MPDDRRHYGAQHLRARAVNAEAWEPMAGMVKTICADCRFLFATPVAEPQALWPDCRIERQDRGCSVEG
jgi:hypothetical protein